MHALRPPLLFAALISLALLLTGCSRGAKPRFAVIDAAVTQRTDEGFVVTFLVEGDNSGDTAVPLRQVRYSLSLGGDRVFQGVRSAEATLPRQGRQQFPLPVAVQHVDWPRADGAPLAEADYKLEARISYLAPGALAEILFDSGFRRPKVSFSERGVLTADAVTPE